MNKRKTEKTSLADIPENMSFIEVEERHRAFLLQALRSASAQLKAWDNHISMIGVALKDGLIGSDTAVQWVRDYDLLWLLPHVPAEIGRIDRTNAPPINRESPPETGVQYGNEPSTTMPETATEGERNEIVKA